MEITISLCTSEFLVNAQARSLSEFFEEAGLMAAERTRIL